MLTGPVPVHRWGAIHSHRGVFTAHKLTVFQQADGDAVEIDGGLVESAEFNLASARGVDLKLSVLKVAVVKLDVARVCLEKKNDTGSIYVQGSF